MDKKYAIFDMDGTLVDSMGFWKGLAGEYLESCQVTPVPEEILERIKPMTMTESAALFVHTFGLPDTPEETAARMNRMMERHYRNDIPLKPGTARYLQSLQRAGVRMCVASATAEPLMEACLKRLGVRGCFEFLLSCEEVGEGKESPEIYLEAARRLGAAPEETAVYEDAPYAAETAKKAGFYVVGVQDRDTESFERLKKLADETAVSWEDMDRQGGGAANDPAG